MRTLIRCLTAVMALALRVLYGCRVEGLERLPRRGPYLLIMNEISTMGAIATSVMLARLVLTGKLEEPTGMIREDGLGGAWRTVMKLAKLPPIATHANYSPGTLWAGLQALRAGHIVSLNVYGDISWDGSPAPIKAGAAWLALRSGVDLVPLVATYGAYEVWPRWERWPHPTGRFMVRIGTPFRLNGGPVDVVDDETITQASQVVRQQIERLVYSQEA